MKGVTLEETNKKRDNCNNIDRLISVPVHLPFATPTRENLTLAKTNVHEAHNFLPCSEPSLDQTRGQVGLGVLGTQI